MVFGGGGPDEFSSPLLYMPLSGGGWCREEGVAEIKTQTKNILETINTLLSVLYNPFVFFFVCFFLERGKVQLNCRH